MGKNRNQQNQCVICLEVKEQVSIKGCETCCYCWSCLVNWFDEQTRLIKITDATTISCPIETCRNSITKAQITKRIKTNTKDQRWLNTILLKNYLRNSKDILSCPNNKCSSYSFIPRRWCFTDYTCSSCGRTWRPIRISLVPRQALNETLTLLYECMFVKNCPNCQVAIYKTGGCSHMACSKCKFQFCWACKKQLYTGKHSEWLCFVNIMSFIAMIAYMWVFLLEITGYKSLCFGIILMTINGIFWWIVIHLIVVCPTLTVICLYKCGQEYRKLIQLKKQNQKFYIMRHSRGEIRQFACLLIVFISFSLLAWGALYLYQSEWHEILSIYCYELVLMLIGICLVGIFKIYKQMKKSQMIISLCLRCKTPKKHQPVENIKKVQQRNR